MHFTAPLLSFVLSLGGLGLLLLGVLDSSFLVLPWGNDLLVVAMTARQPDLDRMVYYAAMSTAGSVLGCLLLDLTMRPLGAQGLEKHLSAKRVSGLKKKVGENAGRALAIASLVPPPFPFTAVVMAAAALQYSRQRLLAIVGVSRMLRFTLLGLLAMRFGERILAWAQNSAVQAVLIALILFCIVGSVASVCGWVGRTRQGPKSRHGAVERVPSATR